MMRLLKFDRIDIPCSRGQCPVDSVVCITGASRSVGFCFDCLAPQVRRWFDSHAGTDARCALCSFPEKGAYVIETTGIHSTFCRGHGLMLLHGALNAADWKRLVYEVADDKHSPLLDSWLYGINGSAIRPVPIGHEEYRAYLRTPGAASAFPGHAAHMLRTGFIAATGIAPTRELLTALAVQVNVNLEFGSARESGDEEFVSLRNAYVEHVRSILAEEDPIGLVSLGASQSAYMIEAKYIVDRIERMDMARLRHPNPAVREALGWTDTDDTPPREVGALIQKIGSRVVRDVYPLLQAAVEAAGRSA